MKSLLLSAIALLSLVTGATAAEIDFNRDVRPILSANCFACHGFDEHSREADLRLDDPEQAYRDRDGVTPLKPGDPSGSEVWLRVSSDDEFTMMPPPDSTFALTAAEKQIIKSWIEQGAKYAGHWSFIPPQKSPLPAVPDAAKAVNAIDRFVLDSLQEHALSPAPPADRHTLIRRLSLDLTGLPPTVAEVNAFVEDDRADAYERLVDRLLASPHFGERLALDWLDAAYADTNGFSIDGGRHMWLWRDWVIQAFNSNKPYDEFLIEQLAGDELPDATPEELIASGFQRNNMVTHEGGTIPEENLTNYNVDRVKTLGEAVLGLTLGCAQCHDHKYDPITQKDYYSMFAYFNTLDDVGLDGNGGVNPRPYFQAKTVLDTGDEAATLRQRIRALHARLKSPPPAAFAAWEHQQREQLAQRGKDLQLLPVTVLKISTPNRGAGYEVAGAPLVRITQPTDLAAYDVSTQLPQTSLPITGLRLVFHPDENTPGNGWGYGPQSKRKPKLPTYDGPAPDKGNFMLTSFSVSAGETAADQVDLFALRTPARITANVWDPQHRPEDCLDPRNQNGWAPPLTHEGPVELTMTFQQPIDAATTPYLTMQMNFGAGDSLVAARVEILAISGTDDGATLEPDAIAALNTPAEQRTPQQTATLQACFAARSPQMQRVRTDLANAEERLAVLTQEFSTMVMNVAKKPRQTFILNRGDYSQPTTPVSMNTPAFLPPPNGPQDSRLALAQWITMPENPLTARVYVNRVWQMLFGVGIVPTVADFGAQGEWPTHPQLLDWLAVDFVENGWDVKRLVKQIVMSATYRQSSVATPELLESDPQNRLLARGPRYRLPAEFIRDAALATSGLLNDQIGGPSVSPYAPGDLWREISHFGSTPATAQTYVQDHGDKLYRRSMYTFWKRTAPPASMAAFDAPNRETCVVSRPTTNTPLQALVMLNDVQFVEAARAFAERIVAVDGPDRAKLQWAMLAALSRPAEEHELAILSDALSRERARYAHNERAARALIRVGESPRDANIPAAEHAAWTQVASTILNLSELVTRN